MNKKGGREMRQMESEVAYLNVDRFEREFPRAARQLRFFWRLKWDLYNIVFPNPCREISAEKIITLWGLDNELFNYHNDIETCLNTVGDAQKKQELIKHVLWMAKIDKRYIEDPELLSKIQSYDSIVGGMAKRYITAVAAMRVTMNCLCDSLQHYLIPYSPFGLEVVVKNCDPKWICNISQLQSYWARLLKDQEDEVSIYLTLHNGSIIADDLTALRYIWQRNLLTNVTRARLDVTNRVFEFQVGEENKQGILSNKNYQI